MEKSTADDLLQQIRESKGSGYLDRAYQRSFSLNVFQMNAVELIAAAQRVKDPDQGMALMMEKNHEAGLQAHRELNRHVHNFVSSSLTLVEHTRVFMRKHYADTELFEIYERQVIATFAKSPIAQFVQGLRNYMLHRGLPNSSMFMKFSTSAGATDGSGRMETGVQYDTASLLDWKDWKSVARTYLEQAGRHLDVHEFAQEYLTLVNQFHGWLDATLATHHRSDLEELRQLHVRHQTISPTREPIAPTVPPDSPPVEPFGLTSIQTADLDRISLDLLGRIRELHLKQAPPGFPSERPATQITDRELIGPVTFWGQEVNGNAALMFLLYEGKSHGLAADDYHVLDSLTDAVMSVAWARNGLSRKFVEATFLDWARQQFPAAQLSFPEALCNAARESVTDVEVWAPIANMEVEQGFDFGPVRIESITAAVMENLRSRAPSPRPEQEQEVNQFFEKLKSEIQGYAVAIVSIEGEPAFAVERARRIAQDAVGLLTFFSPAAARSYLFGPVALAGAEYIPSSKLIALYEGGFHHSESVLPKHVGHWRLSIQQIAELNSNLLEAAALLVVSEGLSEFALAVRASILIYSKGITLVAPLDRLRNCLSALEGVLLRHDMEPRAHSIANRMSFVLAQAGADGEAVKKIVQQIYWLQDQPSRTEQGHRESELITTFTSYAYHVLHVALGNVQTFSSKVQFVIEIDRMGLSRQ
ncbi:hypothetical protein BAR24066_01196 [Burkholderia arboris]|uniref:Uncharacterized protein n=1 Tax=Burkholderia arboris TaxID=488730 RepID=A0A9Q9SFD3_9BURK|nr:hypothetical protein [Burkholderia arboris]VWB28479.1 hypothetical protein BAR24066_01196 [Burkholderia arboris]